MKDQIQNINIGNLDSTRIGGNFWNQLPKPIFCLAPMEEVTDVVFREMFAKYSGGVKTITHNNNDNTTTTTSPALSGILLSPGEEETKKGNAFVMFTEFINVDGILHPTGFERLKIDLEYTENQRPIVAQIWGTDPEKFYEASKLMVNLGFDGIDINMGCPQDKEIGIGACAALIRNPKLASEIIEATIKGAGEMPVSVKTRTGYSKPETETWIGHLLKHNLAAITLHARTKQEKSKVPASWVEVKKAVNVRNTLQSKTLIIGNGDVKSRKEGLSRIAETGCDGVMIARGAFGFPWMFREDNYQPSVKERLTVALEHAKLFQEKLGGQKSFFIMRKHFKAYASGFDGASELRVKLLETKNTIEVESIVNDFLQSLQ